MQFKMSKKKGNEMRKFLLLFMLMLIYAIVCSAGMVFTIWLVIDKPMTLAEVIQHGKTGFFVGGLIGIGIGILNNFSNRKIKR